MKETKIMTYYNYNDISSFFLDLDFDSYNYWIDSLIKDFDLNEIIGFSSFLNMIIQTRNAGETFILGKKELNFANIKINREGILFYRDNILYLIFRKLSIENNGTTKLTGEKRNKQAEKYYKALLLSSNAIHNENLLKDIFLRNYPYFYLPDIVNFIYSNRIRRYYYIFNELLNIKKYKNIIKYLNIFLEKYNCSLEDYFKNIKKIIFWFLRYPLERAKNKNLPDIYGFNEKNLSQFYIKKENFSGDLKFINFFEKIAINQNKFLLETKEEKPDKIIGFYKNFRIFFDYPVFKFKKGIFCILDLRFLMDGMSNSFYWRLNSLYNKSNPNNNGGLKSEYGKLLEDYFIFLVKKIFKNITEKNNIEGEPDAILEIDNYLFIFEFTTEYYKISSLYNENINHIKKDIKKILFNKKIDYKETKKKDEGKFIKLERYIKKYKNKDNYKNKKIIPILITENYLGDCSLIEEMGFSICSEIEKNNLDNLKINKPLIINLDDLENFWQYNKNQETSDSEFLEIVLNWNNERNKGKFHFNFSYFISDLKENKGEMYGKANKDFLEFFDWDNYCKI